jgi:GNAT superfamily N-acetyltransferase
MTATIEALQDYMRAAAAATHDTTAVPPFDIFTLPNDPFKHFNYAMPQHPIHAVTHDLLSELRETFTARNRLLRFEFVEEYAPGLAESLASHGLIDEGPHPLMVCTRETLIQQPQIPGLEIRRLTVDSPLSDFSRQDTVIHRGFGQGDEPEVLYEGAHVDPRASLGNGKGEFLALLDGTPVAGGSFTIPLNGYSEMAGEAVWQPYRGRGIGTALLAAMTQAAFDQGIEVALLSAEDERVGRIWARVGFRYYGTTRAFSAE